MSMLESNVGGFFVSCFLFPFSCSPLPVSRLLDHMLITRPRAIFSPYVAGNGIHRIKPATIIIAAHSNVAARRIGAIFNFAT
jgi:hypothetical protein